MSQSYKKMRIATLNYLQCRNRYLTYYPIIRSYPFKVLKLSVKLGINNSKKCFKNFNKEFPNKCYNCNLITNQKSIIPSYRCNFCGRPLSGFLNGNHPYAEIHHLYPIKSNISRATTWKRAIRNELQTGKPQLEIICGKNSTCHTIAHMIRQIKHTCPHCAKKGLQKHLQTISSPAAKNYNKNHYVCPNCNKKWYKSSTKGIIPLSAKTKRFQKCPTCKVHLIKTKRRHYICSKCKVKFRISQGKKNRGKLIQIP